MAETANRVDVIRTRLDSEALGQELYDRVVEMYPICRSITGDGVRQTLAIVGRDAPLEVHEVPSGTAAFDWTVPKEWNIRDAYITDPHGAKVVDFRRSNLHVVNYSPPVHARMPLDELKRHIFTVPDQPDVIPYRTSYYGGEWGFCLSDRRLQALEEGMYEVVIDSSLEDGHLTYGECYLAGELEDEILVSCHVCHPSLCNDNLSGITIATQLARELAGMPRRYSYRFLFVPATIGSIAWLSRNEERTRHIRHGLVLACLGDSGYMTYKKSRQETAVIDRAVAHALLHSREPFEVRRFSPWGYDERQYCSPAFNLPVGLLSRTPHGEYQEYHTSADDLDFVKPEALADSFFTCLTIFEVLEGDATYLNTNPRGEPQLGRRGLYRAVAGQASTPELEHAMLWVLNLSDGAHSLLDIAERAQLPFAILRNAADTLHQHDLLRPVPAIDSVLETTTR
jgi:aminopeptidase-like protein